MGFRGRVAETRDRLKGWNRKKKYKQHNTIKNFENANSKFMRK